MLKQLYNIEWFNSEISLIKELKSLLRSYDDLFYAVIAHGSVATNEIIPYSDFDGLLIIKDEFANSKRLRKFKKESMKIILNFDPLQHHGWFQILESQLQDYPQNYLPHEILEYSKLIFPHVDKMVLDLNIREDGVDYKRSLKQLINSIESQSSANFRKERLYNFKSYLSKIMLLPSMYYSAKHNKGLFKKYSFEVVKSNFTLEEWACIKKVSKIRSDWKYNLTPVQKCIMTRPELVFRRISKKYISPRIPEQLIEDLDEDFFNSLKLFIKTINKDIFAT